MNCPKLLVTNPSRVVKSLRYGTPTSWPRSDAPQSIDVFHVFEDAGDDAPEKHHMCQCVCYYEGTSNSLTTPSTQNLLRKLASQQFPIDAAELHRQALRLLYQRHSCHLLWAEKAQLHPRTLRCRSLLWHSSLRFQEADLHQQAWRLLYERRCSCPSLCAKNAQLHQKTLQSEIRVHPEFSRQRADAVLHVGPPSPPRRSLQEIEARPLNHSK